MKELNEDDIRHVSGGFNPFGPPHCPIPPGWGTPWEGQKF